MIGPRRTFRIPLPGRPPLELGGRALVMGILNLTDNSFSADGLAGDPATAIARVREIEDAGADLIDIGAESTRPGAAPISAAEELARLHPVLRAVAGRTRVPLSIDTTKAEVANFALDEGVSLVNDISGLQYDPEMGPLIAARGVAAVLMHMRGRPDDMYAHASYADVAAEVARELQRRVERAVGYGIAWDRLLLDPGIGFAKRAEHSLALLGDFGPLSALGRPLLVGPSRKSFLTAATGPLPADQRDWPAAAAVTAAVLGGAHIVRVHRVREMVQVVRVAEAIRAAARA
ncbi:MAG TPA: dihydropteroate synthase [Vicinamibacterales bacterium]|nr:dihydropteroate synthase [Vicinamibacterales bacterium]